MKFRVRNRFAFHILNPKDKNVIVDIIPSGEIIDLESKDQYGQPHKLEELSEKELFELEVQEKKAKKAEEVPEEAEEEVNRKAELDKEKAEKANKAKEILEAKKTPAKAPRKRASRKPKTEDDVKESE